MPKLGTLRPLVRTFHGGALKPQGKRVDPIYTSRAYEQWRDGVIARAGGRCEAVENGERCRKTRPEHRLFADHINEISDGGAAFDPANGQCLCGSHHTLKTTRTRAARLGAPSR
jgi:5-methylcytosine-specific restriction enzyme A